jgi:hypothetical protein
MDNIATNMEALYEKAKEYVDLNIELFRLNAIDKAADVISSLFARLILIMIVAMFILFINLTLSLYIGKQLGEMYLGFLIVSGIYLVLSIFVFYFNNKILKLPLTNLVIAKLLKTKAKRNKSNTPNNEIV